MGTMHVIRDLCQGAAGVTVYAGDLNDQRLAGLCALAAPLADKYRVGLRGYNPAKDAPSAAFDYIVLMAPVPALAAQAVATATKNAIINIFAGIPADKTAAVDLDAYVEKQLYYVGTSGSVLKDMQQVLAKVVARSSTPTCRSPPYRASTARSTASAPSKRTCCPARFSSIPPAAASS